MSDTIDRIFELIVELIVVDKFEERLFKISISIRFMATISM
jgi:hypothetical protein